MTRLRADLLLLCSAIIWGAAFVVQKYGNEHMPPIMFCGVRFALAMFILAPFAWLETKRKLKIQNPKPMKRGDLILAGAIGVTMFIAIAMQQVGLVTTTATNGGFLTALYIAGVPFAAWAIQGIRPRFLVLIACVVCLTGAWLLAGHGVGQSWQFGDLIIIASDIAWAFQIVLISKFLVHTHRPLFLSFIQYGIAGVLGIVVGLFCEPVTLDGIRAALPAILFTGILCAGVAFTFQIVAQRYTPAAEAALIMSLESVFAAMAGAVFLHERLTFLASIGCALIMLGILLVEIGPLLRRR